MERDNNLMPIDSEWTNWITEIFKNGGSVWIIERTDTNQFMVRDPLRLIDSNTPTFLSPYNWVDKFPSLIQAKYGSYLGCSASDLYPTKELAEKYAPKKMNEGGCECCGNGSTKIPIKLVEHEFINP